ncbi:MAG: thioredoxin fold domain-containing protein [Odoribacteraceae bacterium]|nr:thioredoxin fold domain-containing protein [Odoribacteraceae bacterium]
MKKMILAACLLGLVFNVAAQERSISFETTKEWKKVINKAKKEKKLIFVDCYTDWCGPCKMLAANVFTQNEVADYFNRHFVNATFEMEKDKDGILLKDRFAIRAYPTLVFVDPATGEVVHRLVGAGSAEWLLEGAKLAGDPLNNLTGMTKRYDAGERDVAFLDDYLKALSAAYMEAKAGEVAAEYLGQLPEEQLATKENWELARLYVKDPLSPTLRHVMANRAKFYKLDGKEAVDAKLNNALREATGRLSSWQAKQGKPFDEQRNEALLKYLQEIDFSGAPALLPYLYAAARVREGDFRGVLDAMHEAFKYNLFRNEEGRVFFQFFIQSLDRSGDEALVCEGVAWIDRQCAGTGDDFYKANLMSSKARLLTSIGDTAGVEQAKADEERYNAEGEQKSKGRSMRAIRLK